MAKCSIESCNAISYCRGWCIKHYERWRAHGNPLTIKWVVKKCSITSCESRAISRGWCKLHYDRWRIHGDPLTLLIKRTARRGDLPRWLSDHVNYDGNECLTWPFSRHPDGRAQYGGRGFAARHMCRLAHGKPPSKKHLAVHSCGKGHEACVHPKHLRWATHLENMDDAKMHGTIVRGEKRHNAKLTDAIVRQIRQKLYGKITQTEMAIRFGVSLMTISQVVNHKTWRHV